MITSIVAMAHNNVIGLGNTIPWHIPADLKHFKEVTQGGTIIMGRLTWESLPFKPLPNRRNIVLTSSDSPLFGAETAKSIDDVIKITEKDENVFIIGGEHLYRSTMHLVDRLIVSEVDLHVDGDRFFPQIEKNDWTEIERRSISNDDSAFQVVEYMRNHT